MLTGLVLTFNEEKIITSCLSALYFVNELIVFDSYSTDNTVSIAKSFGAKVIQRRFDNFATQRNEALKAVPGNTEWVLMIDADEIVSESLKEEIIQVTNKPTNPVSLYRVRRKDMLGNKWIKRSSGYPTWFGRLFKNGEVWIEREINEEYHTHGKTGDLKEHLIHYPFNKGIDYWFEKHNKYSGNEARVLLKELRSKMPWKFALSKDPVKRRKFQKQMMYRLPFSPILIFIGLFFLRGGFLDGRAGFNFCRLRFMYESMIVIKTNYLKEYS